MSNLIPLSPIGQFLPDQPDRDNPGLTVAENVIPRKRFYGPVQDLVPTSATLPSACRGAEPLQELDGTVHNYAGTDTDLYEEVAGAYGVVGSGYTLSSEEFWEFTAFLNDAAATGTHSAPLQVDPDMGGAFADVVMDPNNDPLITEGPRALHGAVVRDDFYMVGNLSTDAKAVQWCGSGNIGIWTPTVQQSGIQTLQDGGEVTRVMPGEYGIIFKEHAIYRATYIADPEVVFQFDNVAPNRGTLAPGSVVQLGHRFWFLDIDGFYGFDGASATQLGSERFNEFFLSLYNDSFPESISAAIDVHRNLIYWAFPSNASVDGRPDMLAVYNWVIDEFAAPIRIPVERLTYIRTSVQLSDALPIGPLLSDSIDTLSDSHIYKGGRTSDLGAFDHNHALGDFTGAKLQAIVESGEFALTPGRLTTVSGARPVIDGNAPTVVMQFGTRDQTNGAVAWSGDIPTDTGGECDLFTTARYHRFRLKVSGDFDKILGAEPEFYDGGES